MTRLTLLALLPLFAPDDGAGSGSSGSAAGSSGADGASAETSDGDGDDLIDSIVSEATADQEAAGRRPLVESEGDAADPFGSVDADAIVDSYFVDDDTPTGASSGDDDEPDDDEAAADAAAAPDAAAADGAGDAAAPPAPGEEFGRIRTLLAAAIPDAVVETPEALVERHVGLETANREMRGVQDAIDTVLGRYPALDGLLQAALDRPDAAIEELLGEFFEGVEVAVPDRYADPEAHDRAVGIRARLQATREARAAEDTRLAEYRTAYGEQAAEDGRAFVAAHAMTNEAAASFFRRLQRFEQGDPATGRYIAPREKMELFRKGEAYDADVAAAEARGRAAGRAEAAKALRGKGERGAGGAPRLRGAGPTTRGADGRYADPLDAATSGHRGSSIHNDF